MSHGATTLSPAPVDEVGPLDDYESGSAFADRARHPMMKVCEGVT